MYTYTMTSPTGTVVESAPMTLELAEKLVELAKRQIHGDVIEYKISKVEVITGRYKAFADVHGYSQPAYEYMNFIQCMLKKFANSKGCQHEPVSPYRILDHDEFTNFIKIHSSEYKLS